MRRLTALSLLVATSLLLAACRHQAPEGEFNLTFNEETGSSTNTSAPPNAPVSSNLPTTPQKGPMKTLADFPESKETEATLVTSKGNITFTLYRDKAPLTTANFISLAKSGYYNGIVFHRVIPDFMAQVGDPLTKDPSKQAMWGSGGPGYTIADEFGEGLIHDSEGVVSMANAGPNTGGSQFFITYEATPWLNGKHAIFGKVTAGMDVLRQITVGDTIKSIELR